MTADKRVFVVRYGGAHEIDKAIERGDGGALSGAENHPGLTPEHVARAVASTHSSVRLTAADWLPCTDEQLEHLKTDSHAGVRYAAHRRVNDRLPFEHLWKKVMDPSTPEMDRHTAYHAANNKRFIKNEHREQLVNDPNDSIRTSARMGLLAFVPGYNNSHWRTF